AGSSGSGKSAFAMGFLERLEEQDYQFLIVDPKGDYSTLYGPVVLGDDERPPSVSTVLEVLAKPDQNAIVNLNGLVLNERPKFFEALLPRIQELRARTGRPHWIAVDESHQVLPSSWEAARVTVPDGICGLLLITLEPNRIAPAILSATDVVIAIGKEPAEIVNIFSKSVGENPPSLENVTLQPGEALAWPRDSHQPPFVFQSSLPHAQRRRHGRNYAEGELSPDLCI